MKRFIGLIVGIIFILAGCFLFFQTKNLKKNCTVETEAIVVDIEEEVTSDEDGMNYLYYPVIEYKAGGENIRIRMSEGSNPSPYSISDKITILYNPKNHKQYIKKGEKSSTVISIVFMSLGALVTVYGIKMALSKNEG